MSYWRIMTAHHAAHIQPTPGTDASGGFGTASTTWPISNVRNLDPNKRCRVTSENDSGAWRAQIDFDRGTGDLNAINAVAVFGLTKAGGSHNINVYTATAADFSIATTEVSAEVANFDTPQMFTFFNGDNTTRRVRFELTSAGETTYEIGTIALGNAYGLGPDMLLGTDQGNTWTREFRKQITHATADTIIDDWRAKYKLGTNNDDMDGFGCNRGELPIILGNFDSDTDANTQNVVIGPGVVTRTKQWAAYSALAVSLEPIQIAPLNTP